MQGAEDCDVLASVDVWEAVGRCGVRLFGRDGPFKAADSLCDVAAGFLPWMPRTFGVADRIVVLKMERETRRAG